MKYSPAIYFLKLIEKILKFYWKSKIHLLVLLIQKIFSLTVFKNTCFFMLLFIATRLTKPAHLNEKHIFL